MDHLRRPLAPISDAAWAQIDAEATATLTHYLAGRRLVDVGGPAGWTYSAAPSGAVRAIEDGAEPGVSRAVREVHAAVELRTPFELSMRELEVAERGGDAELSPLIEAARRHAAAEDHAIFYGASAAGLSGIAQASPHDAVMLSEDYEHYPSTVARAVSTLRRAGIGGPYALALGPRCYTGVLETSEQGYPIIEHIGLITGGPVLWAPAVEGAVVVSTRGGDYDLVLGEDTSIGYRAHDGDTVELFFEESFTFVVRDERAAVAMRHHEERL